MAYADRVDVVRCVGQQPAVAADDGPHRQVQLAPPRDVVRVAERADHGDAGALVGLRQFVGVDGHLDAVERGAHRGAEERLVPLVVGVGHEGDAGGEQLGAGRVDLDRTVAVGAVLADTGERDLVVGGRPLAVFHLGLGDGGAEVDVPHRRRFLAVGLAAGDVAQEGALAGPARALVDRGVLQRPVDRQAEPAQQRLEDLLVGLDELVAQLEEVGPGDGDRPVVLRRVAAERRLEALGVGLARVAADAVVVLDAALGGQAVVVPAHRVEDLLAGHALVAGDRVGVGVAEHVAHVQRAADGRRRRVDREDLVTGGGAVERVDPVGFPDGGPAILDAIECRSFRDRSHIRPRLPTRSSSPPE